MLRSNRETRGRWRDDTGRGIAAFSGRMSRLIAVMAVIAVGMLGLGVAVSPAAAADNPYQRGPDPTVGSVAASQGSFATARIVLPKGDGFGSGFIYYPTDTSQGTFGALAIVPGYNGTFKEWQGYWLASFGFVVIGIDTFQPGDSYTSRAAQLMAALDYLAKRSAVRDRVDPNRSAVMGHSLGGGGVIYAALQNPGLKTAISLAPFIPSDNLANLRVPMMLMAGEMDRPGDIRNLYDRLPGAVEKAFVELAGEGHSFPTPPNSVMMRKVIPWLKIFVDQDARYQQFLCPQLDPTGIKSYQASCPLLPGGSPSPSPTAPPTSPPSPGSTFSLVSAASGKCVDVSGGSQNNGAGLTIYTCHGRANQRWTQTGASELRVYDNTKCMDAGSSSGSRAVINTCTGATSQKWLFNASGTVTNVQSGLCLDVSNGSTANDAPVHVWTCHGRSNQIWTRRP